MSLLAWYPLLANGNNQGLDEENLTTVGAVTYTKGKLGNAAKFTGNSGVRFRRSNFTEQTNWSVSAWVKCDEATSAAQWCFNNGRDGNNDGWHCYFSAAGTTLYLRIGNVTWSQASTLGTWYHVTMTINENSKYTFFVNGEQKSTGTVTTLPDYSESGNLMAIGGFVYNGGNIYPLNGQVQDFRYYNHCLSKKEVKEISKGLTIHLPMDWGSGKPNIIKNSYTWMNKATGSNNANSCTITKSVIEDDTAPCLNVLKCTITNSAETAKSSTGIYYAIAAQGLTTADLVENETYTYSFWAKSDSGIASGFRYDSVIESQTHVSNNGFGALDNNWRKHTITFRWTKTTKLTCCFYVTAPASSTVDFQLCGIKLEQGDTATPYIPHVEETAYTSKSYSIKYIEDTSGYNHEIKVIGSANISCISPRGLGGTTCGANSCINLGTAPKIQYPFTFAFWFNTSDLSVNNNRLISCTEGGGWNIEATSTNLRWTIGTGTSSNTYKYCDSTKTLTQLQGAWHHIACTYDGMKAQMYIDGALEREVTHYSVATPVYYNNSNAVFLCGEAGSNATTPATTYTVATSVSDFRMYATCLSADDIKELYSIPIQIDKSGKLYCGNLVEV